jgi:hypothetical protein
VAPSLRGVKVRPVQRSLKPVIWYRLPAVKLLKSEALPVNVLFSTRHQLLGCMSATVDFSLHMYERFKGRSWHTYSL